MRDYKLFKKNDDEKLEEITLPAKLKAGIYYVAFIQDEIRVPKTMTLNEIRGIS